VAPAADDICANSFKAEEVDTLVIGLAVEAVELGASVKSERLAGNEAEKKSTIIKAQLSDTKEAEEKSARDSEEEGSEEGWERVQKVYAEEVEAVEETVTTAEAKGDDKEWEKVEVEKTAEGDELEDDDDYTNDDESKRARRKRDHYGFFSSDTFHRAYSGKLTKAITTERREKEVRSKEQAQSGVGIAVI
jgi:hypothetical protein